MISGTPTRLRAALAGAAQVTLAACAAAARPQPEVPRAAPGVTTGAATATTSPAPRTAAPGDSAGALPQPLAGPPTATPNSALARAISAIVDTGALARAHWGIAVRDVASGNTVYERNAARLFIPASALKLVVAAAAAHHLGAEFQYRTEFSVTGAVSDGVLRGDLVVKGTGDPTSSGRDQPDRLAIFTAVADSLRAHGVRRIAGGIIADVSHWVPEPQHGDWEKYDLNWWYAAPTGPLGFNDNSIDFLVQAGEGAGRPALITWQPQSRAFTFVNRARTVAAGRAHTLDFDRVPGTDSIFAYGEIPLGTAPRTESFAVRDPAHYAATVLAETLARAGIAVDAVDVRVVQTSPAEAQPLFTYRSAPLPRVLGPILQTSQNWYAEQLVKTLGKEVRGEGSWRAGLAVEQEFLGDVVGIDTAAFQLRDASGLSNGNLVAPEALAGLVRFIATSPRAAPVREALAVSGGRTGSLRSRLTDLPGRVRAKTGSVRNVATLAGLVRTEAGRELAFAIMANGTGLPAARVNAAIDQVVRVLARSQGGGGAGPGAQGPGHDRP